MRWLFIARVLATLAFVAKASLLVQAQELRPGEGFVTRFSGTQAQDGRLTISLDGIVGSIIDMRQPGGAPRGEHWWNEPQRQPV